MLPTPGINVNIKKGSNTNHSTSENKSSYINTPIDNTRADLERRMEIYQLIANIYHRLFDKPLQTEISQF